MREKFTTSKIEREADEESIVPPSGWYFIHGVKEWSKSDQVGIRSPEISGSLQKDGYTQPLRSYGYILKIDKGAISAAFDRDVTSEYGAGYQKQLSAKGKAWKRKKYGEDDLEELAEKTPEGLHNEIWLQGDKVEIIGAYINEKQYFSPGAKAFLNACQKIGLQVRIIIKKEAEE